MYDEDENENQVHCKVVLIGESGVGKTSIISQFTNKEFQYSTQSTSGATYSSKTIECSNKNKIKFDIWDTAGQERYRALTKMFYKDASAAVLVYDITREDSFVQIKKYWAEQVKDNTTKNIILVIAANKSDLIDNEAVNEDEGRNLANELNAIFLFTSALNSSGIDEIFIKIGDKFFENKYNDENKNKMENYYGDDKNNDEKKNNIKINKKEVLQQNKDQKKKTKC